MRMKENMEAGGELSDTLMTHERIQKNFQISSDIFSVPSPKGCEKPLSGYEEDVFMISLEQYETKKRECFSVRPFGSTSNRVAASLYEWIHLITPRIPNCSN
jgi:hypothetical protein